jgi:uncharacterized protein (DUF362 family)
VDIVAQYESAPRSEARPVSQLKSDGVPPDYTTRVALVRSDDSALNQPVPLDKELTNEQIYEMVARALDLSGDLKPLLFEGARITLKPNVVEAYAQGEGVNTDARVVEGIILWMESLGIPNLNYTVAEAGGGWLAPQMRGTPYAGGAQLIDGFQIAGYRQMIQRLQSRGIRAGLVDANYGSYTDPLSHIRLTPVPDFIDFPEYESYWVHDSILDPDVLINVPVLKIHTLHITVCLKNYIGIAAGARYGHDKGRGGPNPGDPKLHRNWSYTDSIVKEIVDLASIARSEYNVVDAIVGKERYKGGNGRSVQRNMIVAGPDLVAVDAVCSRLMGLNPDDVAHLCFAAREGLGTMDEERITVVGEHSIEESMYYFEHSPRGVQESRGYFGTSNHVWLLNSAPGTDLNTPSLGQADEGIVANPGLNGWTEPIYFSDEFIDFQAYYGAEDDRTYYAFCWVDVPRDEEAELWIDHDEDCALWIGGEKVYQRTRSYHEVSLPEESSRLIQLKKGRHPLLVKLVDRTGSAAFVFNICRIVPRPLPEGIATFSDTRQARNYERYAGTRVFGLKFDLNGPTDVENWRAF